MTTTPQAASVLLPCPFCGGKAHRHYERGSDGVGGYLSMKCGGCGAMSPQRFIYEPCHQTELEIKADWNTRAALGAQKAGQEDVMGKAMQQLTTASKRSSSAKEWEALFWRVAKALKCLPSSFVDSNEHVIRAAEAAAPALVGWQPIGTEPDDMTECVVVRWINSDGEECRELDYKEDGCWMGWHDHAEHTEIIGGHGVSYTPPYAQWLQLPPAGALPGPAQEKAAICPSLGIKPLGTTGGEG